MASWKESRVQKLAPLVATLLLAVSEIIAFQFPSERQIETHAALAVIKSPVGLWFGWFAIILWVTCIVCLVMSIVTRNKWGLLSFLAVLVCPIVAFFSALDESIAMYIDEGSLRDSDGSEYHLFSNSFLQGNKLMLARVVERSGSRTTYSILSVASNSGDANRVRLIRPQGKPEVSAPTITRGRLLIGAPEGYAFVFYDLKQNLPPNDNNNPNLKLSPFVLLGPNDIPNQTDFEEALKDEFNVTDPEVLKSELQNSNPRVREMAKKWLVKVAAKAAVKP